MAGGIVTGRRFHVAGLPAPQGSHKHVGGGRMVESSKRVKPWRRQVATAYAAAHPAEPLAGPLSVTVDFYLPRPQAHLGTGRNRDLLRPSAPAHHVTRPDLDKLTRAIGDALTGIAWPDDSQIVAWHTYKHYASRDNPTGATIIIQELRRC